MVQSLDHSEPSDQSDPLTRVSDHRLDVLYAELLREEAARVYDGEPEESGPQVSSMPAVYESGPCRRFCSEACQNEYIPLLYRPPSARMEWLAARSGMDDQSRFCYNCHAERKPDHFANSAEQAIFGGEDRPSKLCQEVDDDDGKIEGDTEGLGAQSLDEPKPQNPKTPRDGNN